MEWNWLLTSHTSRLHMHKHTYAWCRSQIMCNNYCIGLHSAHTRPHYYQYYCTYILLFAVSSSWAVVNKSGKKKFVENEKKPNIFLTRGEFFSINKCNVWFNGSWFASYTCAAKTQFVWNVQYYYSKKRKQLWKLRRWWMNEWMVFCLMIFSWFDKKRNISLKGTLINVSA